MDSLVSREMDPVVRIIGGGRTYMMCEEQVDSLVNREMDPVVRIIGGGRTYMMW